MKAYTQNNYEIHIVKKLEKLVDNINNRRDCVRLFRKNLMCFVSQKYLQQLNI